MNTEIEQYERIQEFLRGRLSDEDRAAFERDLATDDTLREQYEDLRLLARSINKTNQEVDLRMALEESEKQLAESSMAVQDEGAIDEELSRVEHELKMMGVSVEDPEPSVFHILRDRVKKVFSVIRQWFLPTGYLSAGSSSENTLTFSLSYASRLALSFAVAASLALAIILPYNANLASSGFNYAPSRLELQTYRGSSSDMLEKAINSYNNGDYDSTLSYLEESNKGIEMALSQLGDSDSVFFAKQELLKELFDVDWYSALAYMKSKKVKKAKTILKSISNSDSPYSSEASRILNDVY